MNKLREEITALLRETDCFRPAVLRRSLKEDWLYATDLPQAAEEDATRDFVRRAEAAGWRTQITETWIQLDREVAAFPEGLTRPAGGTEAKCCLSLLERHPEGGKNAAREKRRLIRAAEEGPEAYEKACAALHREWAAALRQREGLPDLSADWFGGEKDT